jgi:hypothetical protein
MFAAPNFVPFPVSVSVLPVLVVIFIYEEGAKRTTNYKPRVELKLKGKSGGLIKVLKIPLVKVQCVM